MSEPATLHKFPGGLKLAPRKAISTRQAVTELPVWAGDYVLPLRQHLGEAAEALVAVGESVLAGQPIARGTGVICAGLCAPTSGTITAIESRPFPHPSGLSETCLVLEADGEDRWIEAHPIADWRSADTQTLLNQIREAGIVGLGGAVFPTHIKLMPHERRTELLVLNGAECEPYISCDDMLMRERAADVVEGALIMQRILGSPRVQIAIEDDKVEARAALETALDRAEAPDVELVVVPARYPEGGEKQLIQTLTGKEVPADGLPIDIGIVCQNVGTAAAVADAVVRGRPLVSRVVTVTGGGVAQPRNLNVRLGTPFSKLIDYCGGYTEDIQRLLMGGPMMGFAVRDDNLPVIKATNCILVATAEEIRADEPPMPCIRCGDCAAACPASLLPQTLYWHARAENFEAVEDNHIFDCIECGCCDVVCPSHIPLVSYFRYAKTEIWGRELERAKADKARERHEARQERLEREKAEREAKRRRKQEALEKNDAKAEIAAALERAKQKKREQQQTDDSSSE